MDGENGRWSAVTDAEVMERIDQLETQLQRVNRKLDRISDEVKESAAAGTQPSEQIPVVGGDSTGEKGYGHKKIADLAIEAKSSKGVTVGRAEEILGLSRSQTLAKMRKMASEFEHLKFRPSRGGNDPSRLINREGSG